VPVSVCDIPGYWCYWHGGRAYSGVALHVRRHFSPARPAFDHPEFDQENRIVTVTIGDLTVASVYVPNGGKDFAAKMKFLEELVAWSASLRSEGKHLVLCGDFNVARTDKDVHPLERKKIIGQLPEERALIEQLFAGGMIDVGRHVDPDNERLFTWWAPWRNMRGKNIGWRLDYVAASNALVDAEVKCVAYREVGTSDHAPVISELRDTPGS
jgi:exodeoxyribonuclease-3